MYSSDIKKDAKKKIETFIDAVNAEGEDGLELEYISEKTGITLNRCQHLGLEAVKKGVIRRVKKKNSFLYYPAKEGVESETDNTSKFVEAVKKHANGFSPEEYAEQMNYTDSYAGMVALQAYKKGLVERERKESGFVYVPIKECQKKFMKNYSDEIDSFFNEIGKESVANVPDLEKFLSDRYSSVDLHLRRVVDPDSKKMNIGKYVVEKLEDVPQGRWVIYNGSKYINMGTKEKGYFQVKKSFLETAVKELDKSWFASRIELANSTKVPTQYKDLEKLSGFIITYLKRFGVEAKYESEKLLKSQV